MGDIAAYARLLFTRWNWGVGDVQEPDRVGSTGDGGSISNTLFWPHSYYRIFGTTYPHPAQANGVGLSRKPTLRPKSGGKTNIPARSTFRFTCQ